MSIKPKWYWIPLFPFIPFFIAAQLLTPTPATAAQGEPDKNKLEDITQPTTEEGRTISQFFGTVMAAPNCVWSGDLKTKKTESHDIHSGYAYFLGMMWTFGAPLDNLLRFYRDDNLAFKGKAFSTGDGDPIFPAPGDSIATTNFRATFRAQTGKAREKGLGGSRTGRSKIRLYRGNQPDAGENSDAIDSYLAGSDAVGDSTRYPGIAYMAMNRVFIGDDAQAVPAYTCVVKRVAGLVGDAVDWPDYEVNATSSGYDEDYADANPAYVLVYILTNNINENDPWAGFSGIDFSLIDIAAFKSAGATLKTEGTGISFKMDDSKKAGDWIDEICRHIDARVFFDDTQGLITIKLIRDDYVVADLEEITSDDYSNLVISRKTQWELNTDLEIKYTSRRTMKETGLALIINGALRDMLGVVKGTRVVLPMFTYPAAAQAAADRMVRRYFYPLFAGSFTISRNRVVLKPGDVFVLPSVPIAGITVTNIICRVMGVSGVDGEGGSGGVSETLYSVEWAEDVFNNTGVGIGGADEGDYTETDWRITNPYRFTTIKDAPQELASRMAVMVLTARPSGQIATDWQLQQGELIQDEDTGEVTGEVNLLGEGQVYATALLNAAYSGPLGNTAAWLDTTATGFTFDFSGATDLEADWEEFEDSDTDWQKLKHRILVDVGGTDSPDFEIIGVKKLENLGSGIWRATGIIRRVYATGSEGQPTPGSDVWPDNSRIWMLGLNNNLNIVDISDVEPRNGETYSVNLVQFNQYETGDPLALTPTYSFRAETPYPVEFVTGARVADGPDYSVNLEWSARVRQALFPLSSETSIDSIPVADGDPELTQKWQVASPIALNPPVFTILGAQAYTYVTTEAGPEVHTIKAFSGGRFSSGVDFEV